MGTGVAVGAGVEVGTAGVGVLVGPGVAVGPLSVGVGVGVETIGGVFVGPPAGGGVGKVISGHQSSAPVIGAT